MVLVTALAAVLLFPAVTVAHADLETSDPAQGAVLPSPFTGPIVLTFSEHLADGSKADLVGPDGATIAQATVDADAMTMTLALSAPLEPGAYEVRWVSIADDGDVLRLPIVKFTVAPGPSPSPSPTPIPTTQPSATPVPTAVAATPTPSAAPTPVASAGGDTTGSGGDVVLPIVVVLIVLGAGAAYLLIRRNRPADPA